MFGTAMNPQSPLPTTIPSHSPSPLNGERAGVRGETKLRPGVRGESCLPYVTFRKQADLTNSPASGGSQIPPFSAHFAHFVTNGLKAMALGHLVKAPSSSWSVGLSA